MSKSMTNKTKFYVCVNRQKISDKMIYYFFFSKGFWVNSLIKIGEYNYIVSIDYDNEKDIESLNGDFNIRAIKFHVRRIFKSLKIIKAHNGEPTLSFLASIAILASSRIKGVDVKIVSQTKEGIKWKNALLKLWQEEIDHPKRFKDLGIKLEMDISPDGKLVLHINKVGNYIITYFDADLNKYYTSIKRD